MSIEDRMIALGITLPEASNPQGSYTNCVQSGNLLFVFGKGPVSGTDPIPCGKLGQKSSMAALIYLPRCLKKGVLMPAPFSEPLLLRANLPIIIDSIFEVAS